MFTKAVRGYSKFMTCLHKAINEVNGIYSSDEEDNEEDNDEDNDEVLENQECDEAFKVDNDDKSKIE